MRAHRASAWRGSPRRPEPFRRAGLVWHRLTLGLRPRSPPVARQAAQSSRPTRAPTLRRAAPPLSHSAPGTQRPCPAGHPSRRGTVTGPTAVRRGTGGGPLCSHAPRPAGGKSVLPGRDPQRPALLQGPAARAFPRRPHHLCRIFAPGSRPRRVQRPHSLCPERRPRGVQRRFPDRPRHVVRGRRAPRLASVPKTTRVTQPTRFQHALDPPQERGTHPAAGCD